MTEVIAIASVIISEDFLTEIDQHAPEALNWTRESIAGWGLTIAGESYSEGKRSGPVFLGQDGGVESRHVGHWRAV
jgi:hypothetical protein